MDYTKLLKEAGFPQYIDGPMVDDSVSEIVSPETHSYVPTLFELIQACGDRFYSLKLNKESKGLFKWIAESDVIDFEANSHIVCAGETPEEAVALLWIDLNQPTKDV